MLAFAPPVSCARRSIQVTPAARRVCVHADGSSTETPDKPIEDAGRLADGPMDSVKPRVDELRDKMMKDGTSDPKEIMKFDGVAPELVNGRLAMVGFFAGVCAELVSHVSVFEQFKRASGPIFGVAALITLASVIPIVRGTSQLNDGEGEGPRDGVRPGFNITNELINGRAAMFGLALLLVYEAGARGPLF